MLYLFDGKHSKQRNCLFVSNVIFIREIPQQIRRKVIGLYTHFAKDDIGFVVGRRVIDHMPKGVRIVECRINSFICLLCTETVT
jgi:hypothetical protein